MIFSNCGAEEKIKIAGRVVVRNPFGYLPGVDYYKWPLYGYLALLYLVLLGYESDLFCVIRKYIDLRKKNSSPWPLQLRRTDTRQLFSFPGKRPTRPPGFRCQCLAGPKRGGHLTPSL